LNSGSLLHEVDSLTERRSFQLFLLAVAAFASDFGRNAVGPLQEVIRGAVALTDNQMALLQGTALAFPQVVAAVPLGLIVDRYPRGRVLLAFALVNVLGTALTAAASGFVLLFAARCLVGVAVTATGPAAYSLMGDLYPAAQRGRAAMVFNIGACIGMSAVFALGGLLVSNAGANANEWRSAMLWFTGALALGTLLLLCLREPPRTGQIVQNASVSEACSELWRYRKSFGLLMMGWVMVQVGGIAAAVWTTPTLSRNFGLTSDRVGGLVGGALFLSGLVGPVAGGLLADWSQRTGGPLRTMTVLTVLSLLGVGASVFPLAAGSAVASALFMLFLLVATAISTMSMTLTIVIIPNELRGLCIALYTVTGAVGMAIAPLAVSLLSGYLGGAALIGKSLAAVAALTTILAAAAFARGRRYIPANASQS
jgi:MFS family permease